MLWAANRKMTRVEDRAYSLLGLLDVNMLMLYGEGEKAFHHLQLEIIRMSNDQSIFAWDLCTTTDRKTGSTLADDPGFFWDCGKMKLMDQKEFIEYIEDYIPEEELRLIKEDRLGSFPITNLGIQIWMPLHPCVGPGSVFRTWLPCHQLGSPVQISLAFWKSNYCRYFKSREESEPTEGAVHFRQVHLQYQDTPHHDITFEIDDDAIIKNGFTYCGTYPRELAGNIFTLTSTDLLTDCHLAVGFGQCFGQDWIHVVYGKFASGCLLDCATEYNKMLVRGLEHARSMAEVRSGGGRYGRVWVRHTCLLRSTSTLRTSCIMWESSGNFGVKIEVIQDLYGEPDKWTGFDVEGSNDPNRDLWGLMIPGPPGNYFGRYRLVVDGVSVDFSRGPDWKRVNTRSFQTVFELLQG
ncbi:hypothetical protein V8B97DRAFT_2011603 [Scleroderma yunnanense]